MNTNSNNNGLLQLYQALAGPAYDLPFVLILLVGETILSWLIITHVAYTEIDWNAYMQEVEAWWVQGEHDYRNIRGDTGPLVYPAGFLYLFALLRHWTDEGRNIRRAQFIFAGFYVLTQGVVLSIFDMTVRVSRSLMQQAQQDNKGDDGDAGKMAHRIWSWRIAMGCLCLSKRLHSIFLLRLFNDGPTMLLLYVSVLLFMNYRWNTGCVVFSLAVSLKMNVLLFAPGLLLLLLQISSDLKTAMQRLLLFCALPQVILGAPFLMAHPVSYLRKAFELDRVFFYQWTVNWKFLPEEAFALKSLSLLLLGLHLGGLAALALQWLDRSKQQTGRRIFWNPRQQQLYHPCPQYIAYTLLVSNFVGIAFARTLHYQFYAWYFHAVPYLLWFPIASGISGKGNDRTSTAAAPTLASPVVYMGVVLGIETAFLTFPATAWSSLLLQVCHVAVLWQIRPPRVIAVKVVDVSKKKIN